MCLDFLEYTEVVCRHHDSIFILEGKDACSSDNGLSDKQTNKPSIKLTTRFIYYSLSVLDALREHVFGTIVRSLCDRIGAIRVMRIVFLRS